MSEALSQLVPALVSAQSFEQAAVVTLRTQLRLVSEEISRSYGEQGRVLRVVLQLRPEDTYQRLVALEWEDAQAERVDPAALAVGEDANLLASATAWRTVPRETPYRAASSTGVSSSSAR